MALSDLGATPPDRTPPRGPARGLARLGDAFAALRNRLYASEAFQQFCVRFWPTQSISNTYAKRLFDMAVGFSYARVLHACVKLDLFQQLRAGPETVAALAHANSLPLRGMRTLCDAACALELMEPSGEDAYRLGPLGAAMLGNPGVEAMIAHHSLLYEDLRDPIALLRGEISVPHVQAFWPYGAHADPGAAAAYSQLMAKTQAMIARVVVAAYPFRRHRLVMDIGGGEGVFLSHVAKQAPRTRLRVVDWPAVAERAAARFAAEGLSERADSLGFDARDAELPQDADCITFVRVLHDHDDDDAMALLNSARRALPKGGRVLVAEPMAETAGAAPMGAAYFGLYLTAMGQGRPRTATTLKSMLAKAGARRVYECRTAQPVLVRLLVADL